MSFQKNVNYNWPEGFPGEIASANPMRSAISPIDGLRAGKGGLKIAAFAWYDPSDDSGETVINSGSGKPAGFVFRNQQGLTTQYLQEATMDIPQGKEVTLEEGGDYFAISKTDAVRGHAVYADLKDGSISTAPKGSAPEGTADTGWVVSKGASAGTVMIMTGPMFPMSDATPAPKPEVTVTLTPASIKVGETSTASGADSYTSSDESVASVSGSTITAVKAGSAVITGTKGGQTGTATLTVTAASK